MKKDKYVMRILGGVGNQMFQYAYVKSLSIRTGIDFVLDFSGFRSYKKIRAPLLKDLSIEEKSLSENLLFRWLRHPLGRIPENMFFQEKEGCPGVFDEDFYNLSRGGYITGYFQSEKYFNEIREELLKAFTPRAGFSAGFIQMQKQISEDSHTSVSLHIRRGDYVLNSVVAKIHGGCCPLSYYEESIRILSESLPNMKLYIFSDDMEWVRQNFKTRVPVEYMDHTPASMPYEDIWLMAGCDHHIIANSSFSWWGAWLNDNPEKTVIAPRQWFAEGRSRFDDIYCEGWLKL